MLFHLVQSDAVFGLFIYNLIKSNQCNRVRNYHEIVKEVGKAPYKITLKAGAEKYKTDSQNGIYYNRFFAKQILKVDLTEKVPTDDG